MMFSLARWLCCEPLEDTALATVTMLPGQATSKPQGLQGQQ